ncbi:MAG: TIGR03862 family flavoprotein [Bacteroidia bacterium]
MSKKKILIIGSGPAALIAADVLGETCEVHVFEKGEAPGRKFLVAGKGGFNLTNSLTGEALLNKYTPVSFFNPILAEFDSVDTGNWLLDLGIPTYEGTSGRIFPEKNIKPITVLQKIRDKLAGKNVQFHFNHEFISFDEKQQPVFNHKGENVTVEADHYLFALGGASWPVTGSTGSWTSAFENIGVTVLPFQSSNCGVNVDWPAEFKEKLQGMPLKNISLRVNDFFIKGEVLISEYGLEGNAIYPAIPAIRKSFAENGKAEIHFDLKPDNSIEQLSGKVKEFETLIYKSSGTNAYKEAFNLDKARLILLKTFTTKEEFLEPEVLVSKLKDLVVPVSGMRKIEEAISTIGGISLDELNEDLSLKKFPTISVAGEMLDWDAPTGGFLLQACFSTGYFAAMSILEKLNRDKDTEAQ